MQVRWDKTSPNPLNRVGAGLAAADDGRECRLHCKHFHIWPMFFEELCRASDVAASANAGDHRINRRVGKISKDFWAGGADVHLNIGWIFKLLRHPSAGGLLNELNCAFNCAFHALFTRGEVKRRTVCQHQSAALNRHAFGHHKHELVTLYRCHHREANASIA